MSKNYNNQRVHWYTLNNVFKSFAIVNIAFWAKRHIEDEFGSLITEYVSNDVEISVTKQTAKESRRDFQS